MGHHKGQDHDRILAALGLVDCGGVSQRQLLQLRHIVDNFPSVKVHGQLPVLCVNPADKPDIPVEHFLVVVVADLHDFVVETVLRPASAQQNPGGIHGRLQPLVQVDGSQHAPLHGGQDLNIPQRGNVVVPGEVFREIFYHQIRRLLRRLLCREKEIGVLPAPQVDGLAPVDPVGVQDDAAALGLTENFVQAKGGNDTGIQKIRQHISRAHAGKLIHISHQNQCHGIGHRLQQIVHQHDINHGALVHDQHIALQRMRFIFLIPLRRLELQQPMNGLRLHAGGLGEPFGSPACGRRQKHLRPRLPKSRDDPQSRGGLAGARPTGQDEHLAGDRLLDGPHLGLVVAHTGLPGNPIPQPFPPDPDTSGITEQTGQTQRRSPLGEKEGRQVDGLVLHNHILLSDHLIQGHGNILPLHPEKICRGSLQLLPESVAVPQLRQFV